MIERTTRIVVLPPGEPLFSEMATEIEIQDEAGGEFVVLRQCRDTADKVGEIVVDTEEWPFLRAAIDRMVAQCQPTKEDLAQKHPLHHCKKCGELIGHGHEEVCTGRKEPPPDAF